VFSNCLGDPWLQVNGYVQFNIGTEELPALALRQACAIKIRIRSEVRLTVE